MRIRVVPWLLGLALALAACSGPAPPGAREPTPGPPTLRLALGGTPSSLDPALQREPWERALASFYTEALLAPRPDLQDVEPAAASAYDVSPDGLTYTFHLRSDGRFSDGGRVTAADFVTAWRRLIDPRVGSPHADLFASIVRGGAYAEALGPGVPHAPIEPALAQLGLIAPDPLTFQVTLAHPAPWFKWLATVWAGAPAKVVGASVLSNGPFAIASTGSTLITLTPNRHYRRQPRLGRIDAYEIGAGQDAVQMFKSGLLDLAPVDAGTIAQVRSSRTLRSELRQVPQL